LKKIFLKASQPTQFRKNIFENPTNNVLIKMNDSC